MAAPATPDLCVIGGGPAGFAMASAAVGLGLSCILIDEGPRLGRSQAADLAADILLAARPGDTWAALRDRAGRAIAARAPQHDAARLRAMGVTVLGERARFLDPDTLAAGVASIRARRFVVATGAAAVPPPADAARGLLTPEALPTLDAVPPRLAVLGGTAAALEWAQLFARLGAAVTLAGPAPAVADPEFLDAIRNALARDGVETRWGDEIDRIAGNGAAARHDPGRGTVTAGHVLAAGFRAPRVADLGLDRAGVGVEAGAPVVRGDLRTRNPRVYAIGDVLGGTGGASAIPVQVGLVIRAAFFRQPVRYRPERVPTVVRTSPALARVGWSEAEARDRAGAVAVHRWPLADAEGAAARGDVEGWVKVVATPGGTVLGVTVLGPGAGDLIVPWCVAVARNISLDAMASVPGLADASRRAALSFVAGRLRRPWVRRTLGLLRRLG